MFLNSKSESYSHIYESINGTPEENVAKIMEMMGGIEKLIGREDIVIIKPNAQWYGHGITNTNTIKGFIDLILAMKNFEGEIIIAENHHYLPDNSRGWTTTIRNGDFNLNELISYYHSKGIRYITKYHWCDGGPTHSALSNKAHSGGLVSCPEEGNGYVWTDVDYEYNELKAKMSYPIFTSSYSGRKIDFKNGAWQDGSYLSVPVKFINIAGLNHHGNTGVTATIKNFLGVIDMTCGFLGDEPEDYYNFHYIGFHWPRQSILRQLLKKLITSKIPRRIRYTRKAVDFIGPGSGAMGGAVGCFMKRIRKADLNIIAAEYIGHESRWRNPIRWKAVLCSEDPVALDYYASKYILYPLKGGKHLYHDPDNPKNALHKYLKECHAQGIGTLDERRIMIDKYDFKDKSLGGKRVLKASA